MFCFVAWSLIDGFGQQKEAHNVSLGESRNNSLGGSAALMFLRLIHCPTCCIDSLNDVSERL